MVRAAALTPGPVAIVIRLYLARGWRTDLPRLVLLLQAGNAVSFFGYGLILPFEIIYLHQIRGFATATAGLVLAAILGTATLVTPPSGALLDHFRPKPILIAGNLTSALGYAGFAFVDRPWQAFACAVVGGAGVGAARTANQTLLITLVTPEQRAASFALGRVASNLGLGSGATVAGLIVASAQHLRSFQTLYLFDAMACAKAIAAGDPSYRTVRGILAAGAERDQLPAAAGDGGAAPPHRDASCHSLPPAHPGRRSPPCAQIQILCARPVAPTARLTTTQSRRYGTFLKRSARLWLGARFDRLGCLWLALVIARPAAGAARPGLSPAGRCL